MERIAEMESIQSGSAETADYIHKQLQAYNSRYITDGEELCYFIENEAGACVAGIVASRDLDCLTVDYLFVDEAYRKQGYGAKLLAHLEAQAARLSAKRIILNTFGFQAPAFYEKQGYALFGKLEPCFQEVGQYFFKKELLSPLER